ncbi:unnamed protein product [Pieris macdunnoughi]|uniref:Uncharacterized protein n=1 Tax=Pieris macdunnoughi TaxID=345717 RepID=A0A821XQ47_9NEOP|nr:unnamed protein product [Pieris macdunnoughi]
MIEVFLNCSASIPHEAKTIIVGQLPKDEPVAGFHLVILYGHLGPVGTCMFCYDWPLTLVLFKPKPNKMVYVLSSYNKVAWFKFQKRKLCFWPHKNKNDKSMCDNCKNPICGEHKSSACP